MSLREYVRCRPAQADRQATLAQVAREMAKCGAGAVVITDDGKPVGIVTEHDIVVRAVAHRYPADARVDSVMSTDLVTLPEDTDPVHAVIAFRDHAVRHLPVVDRNGDLVDVLPADDLLIGLAGDLVELAETVNSTVGGIDEADDAATA